MMEYTGLERLGDDVATLGEGPVWDARIGVLYWVDIVEGRIHAYDAKAGTRRTIQLEQMVGAAIPAKKPGHMVLALQHGFHELDLATGGLRLIADPESDLPGNRFNDGKCDPVGRFWAGTMSIRNGGPVGAFYCLEPDGRVRQVLGGITCSNGLDWSPDYRTMYYIDSPTKQVMAFTFDLSEGTLTEPRTVVTIPEGEGEPDGMTVDSEGMLWVAQWGGWQVSRWNPATGERVGSVRVPASNVTSCTFGGDNDDVLYITTARIGLTEEERKEQPEAGGLFRIHPGVKGRAASFYGA